MYSDEARARFAGARVALLATVRPDGRPHVVPVTFVLTRDVVLTAVDHKPKTTRELQRLRNIAAEPRVCLLADHYDEDWSTLWWVRADGRADIASHDLAPLIAKYPQYRDRPPDGPVIRITIHRWTGWAAG